MATRLRGERIDRVVGGATEFADERVEVARWAAKQVENGVRTGKLLILEMGVFPSLSAEFGEARRRKVKAVRYGFLKSFEPFRRFSERRIMR